MNTDALKKVPTALLEVALAAKQAGMTARELSDELNRFKTSLSIINSKRAKRKRRVKR